jgi:hypothetical protein
MRGEGGGMMATKADCIDMVRRAGASDTEADEIVDMVLAERKRIEAEGRLATASDLAAFATTQAEKMKQAAAMERRHAALNVLARQQITEHMTTWTAKGGSPVEGLMSYLVGSHEQVAGARDSIAAKGSAILKDWAGGVVAKVEQIPGALKLVKHDRDFLRDVVREMYEIRPDGKAGVSGSDTARQVAGILSDHAEMARVRLNEAGAFIGKIDGWVPQVHDEGKLVKAGKERWIETTRPLLDLERSFEGKTLEEVNAILGEVYENIITGRDRAVTAREKGQYMGPRNLARGMGQHRVLHFADADSWLKYHEQFGRGNVLANIVHHLEDASRKVALMEAMGPNPETMLTSVVEEMRRLVREHPGMDPKAKDAALQSIKSAWEGGRVRKAMEVVTGNVGNPVNRQLASFASGVRAFQSMSKLGGAVLSSFADVVTYATNYRYMGRNLFEGYLDAFHNLMVGRGNEEQRQLAMALGTIYDGILGDVMARFGVEDAPVHGRISSLMNTFFKVSGLNLWTDTLKGGYVRGLSAWMGEHAGKTFKALDAPMRSVLEFHRITPEKWAAMGHMVEAAEDGRGYMIPHLAERIPDEALRPLIGERMEAVSQRVKDPEALASHEEFLLRKEREKLRTEVMAFFTDETAHAVLEPDARTRVTITQGARPATLLGEAMRFIMQFKSFPIAMYQYVLREKRFGVAGETGIDVPGFIQFAAGMMVFGYASGAAKDFVKGKEPRNPAKWETWMAAAAQSGGLGIFGDYLFGTTNRFGNTMLESAAGPGLSTLFDVASLPSKVLHGDLQASDFFKLAMDNTPFVNLWYTRAAADYLLLYHLREMMSPGTLRRMEKRAKEEYNQEFIVPPSRVIRRGGGFR